MEIRASNCEYLQLIEEERQQRLAKRELRKKQKLLAKPDAPILPKQPKQLKELKIKKKITKKKSNKDNKNKAIKKKERLDKLKNQLYNQMKLVQERVDRMDKDKELYYLVGYTNDNKGYNFKIVKKNEEDKVLTIKINPAWETTCSCMDWRIRCR